MNIILLIVCLAVGETISARLERSFGGTPISIEEASFFVSIQLYRVHVCGGALVTGQHVLTAAICIVDSSGIPDFTHAVVTGTDEKYQGGTEQEITDIIALQDRLDYDYTYDAAILVLRDPVNLEGTLPITLPIGRPTFYVSARFFGLESATGPSHNTLHELPVMPYSNRDKSNSYAVDRRISSKIFVGLIAEDQSLHFVDVGGPLVQNGRLIGIALPIASQKNNTRSFKWVYKLKEYIEEVAPTVKFENSST